MVAIVKGFSGFDGFFYKLGPCAGDVINLEWIPNCSFGPEIFLGLESREVHGLRWVVIGEISLVHGEIEFTRCICYTNQLS